MRSGVARRHSSSNLVAPRPQYPNLHRPSESSFLGDQFIDLYVDGKPQSTDALSPTSSSYSEHASPRDLVFLHVPPPPHRLERRHSDSMGGASYSRMHYRNHSESQLPGVQATTRRSNSFVGPQEATNIAENIGSVLQYDDCSVGNTLLPASTSASIFQSHSSFHEEFSNVGNQETLAVPSNFHGRGASHLQIPQSHGKTPRVARRHSSSDLAAHPHYPTLHRPRRPSESSLLAEQFNDLHVNGNHSLLSPDSALSPISSSSSEYASPSDPAFLHVQRLERRYSDSMGGPSHSSLKLGMHYRNHSESQLGTALVDETNNSYAVTQDAENTVGVLHCGGFSGTSWPIPSTGLSSPGEVRWDEAHLAVEGPSSTYRMADLASDVDMQAYGYPSSSLMYAAPVQHSEEPPPSGLLGNYSSPFNGFGLVGPSYKGSMLPVSQHSLYDNRRTTRAEVFGERAPAGHVPTSMGGVDLSLQVAPHTLSSAAGSVVVGSQPGISFRHTRRERKRDPKAVEKMRWKNKVAQFFCYLCSPACSFTIKSARDSELIFQLW
ncbi:hypothetical protein CPB85DRAFT_602065 [Mucidula mucida]|nr:hypothetical protein CPB85DRAFT_602065 [Mucidula mucida]